jgi:molybdopterin-guanine dinucleotide biosynthesis protein A
MPQAIDRRHITGLVLAGGRGSRMGGIDKGLQPWRGLPLARQVLQRLQPQVGAVLINANRNLEVYRAWGHPVVSDQTERAFAGPLAGFLAGLDVCATPYLLTAPCDSPLLPVDLAARLGAGLLRAGARIALPRALGRLQPVFCLIDVALRDDLRGFVAAGGSKIDEWTARHPTTIVDFDDARAFENINTQDDLQRLERMQTP